MQSITNHIFNVFSFVTHTAHAGEGALSVTIRAAGQEVKHSIQDLANGQYDILFYPTMAIPHKFDVKYNGLPITSSPIEAKVHVEKISGYTPMAA